MGLLDKLIYFSDKVTTFANGHGVTTNEDRSWEDTYRQRWQHDKEVRSTHGVNCTGSCSWRIFVKNGLVTWELQQTNYPETRPDLPNHEPRGCPRGASYSWYLYSANRVKYPLVRSELITLWRDAKKTHSNSVDAWNSIISDPEKTKLYKSSRGMGGFVRAEWDELIEIIAAANILTIKKFGPDRIMGMSPIPAMSMISYAAGTRYLSLIGGGALSFYDWYADLPPSSPQVFGEQTDVPESADWYNSSFLMLWGSNVPMTRTPDAPFYTQVRYKGTKTVVISPDYNDASRFSDLWMKPKQGSDAALGLAMGHVILKEFFIDSQPEYFQKYTKQYTDLPFLVKIKKENGYWVPENNLRASDFENNLNQENNPEWKPVLINTKDNNFVVPNGTIGSRWGEDGNWNLKQENVSSGQEIDPLLGLSKSKDEMLDVAFPYYGGDRFANEFFKHSDHKDIITQKVPVRKINTKDGEIYVTTIFELNLANYGVKDNVSYETNAPYTPKWAEEISGVPAEEIITIARQFAENADKTHGKSMIIVGAGINHWYHTDTIYRPILNMLMFTGCLGQSGGGWAHYVGQEKLRPQTGWAPLAFGLDWSRPPRHMNSTSFYYLHTNQWRYEKLKTKDLLSPLADPKKWNDFSLVDFNVKAERMGWLPSLPQLDTNPLDISSKAKKAGVSEQEYIVDNLKKGDINFASEDPDNPQNFPRNLFVWRSNLLGSSAKGLEYFNKHLLGTQHGILNNDLGEEGAQKPKEVKWHENAPVGKLDLLVNLDFRMSNTGIHSDILLPAASWYEKNDISTSDMHPFIHPFSKAVSPVWESKSDWDIFKLIAKKFSELSVGHLGVEKDIVTVPLLHDTPGELSKTGEGKEWKKGEIEAIPGKTMPNIVVVERDYPNTYNKFTSLGPLLEKLGNGSKGMNWDTKHEVEFLKKLNRTHSEDSIRDGRPKIETDIEAIETVLSLAPETNGEVAVKAWKTLSKNTGIDHSHLAITREDEKIRYRDLRTQPRKIITSPTWSGVDSEEVSYTANYTNVHELIPWRTLTGRLTSYQDHPWMRAFGAGLTHYKPPIDTKTIGNLMQEKDDGNPQLAINMITPHNKWTIHTTWSDNLTMLTLGRGGPVVWLSEDDAKKIGVVDNDWVEIYNKNGASVARVILSQRVPSNLLIMYHSAEKHVNMPGSKTTGNRGGIHNSLNKVELNPTHMIGGYAQLSWGFNYYGTLGTNRDEIVVIRKLDKVDWMDD